MIWLDGRFLDAFDVLQIRGAHNWDGDDTVREYVSKEELIEHAGRRADHLGSVSGVHAHGTWLRFSAAGTNLIAEQHDHVRLIDILSDLGTLSFADETMYREEFTAGSHVRELYLPEARAVLSDGGINPDRPEYGVYGLEAFHPKIAAPLPLLVPLLDGTHSPASLVPIGVVAGYVLRYLWAYAKDITAGTDPVQAASGYPATPAILTAERRLAAVAGSQAPLLSSLIDPLRPGGTIATEIHDHDPRLPALRSFINAAIDLMFVRAAADTRLGEAARKQLGDAPRRTPGEQAKVFALWRDLHFERTVADAAARHVRYLCLGARHIARLIRLKKVPDGVHIYDLRPAGAPAIAELQNAQVGTLTAMTARTREIRDAFARR